MNDKKTIKTAIRKQLKNQIPSWNRMNKKDKRKLGKNAETNKFIKTINKLTLKQYLYISEHYIETE